MFERILLPDYRAREGTTQKHLGLGVDLANA